MNSDDKHRLLMALKKPSARPMPRIGQLRSNHARNAANARANGGVIKFRAIVRELFR